MGHAGDPNEFLEILCNELWPVVGNNPWAGSWIFFLGSLQDDFNIWFGHLLSDLPVDDGAAASIQETAQVVEGATDVEVRDIHVPVLMGEKRLYEPCPFERRFLVPLLKHACF